MGEEIKAVDKTVTEPAAVPVSTLEDDKEAKIASLEAEKAKLIEESANYKLGMLKAKRKAKEEELEPEGDDDRLRQIAREELAGSRLAEISRELDAINRAALKENRELKLALANKTTVPPAALGTHSETVAVMDTLVTPDQMAAFKARGWSDKDIERYKRNIQKNSR